MQKGSGGMAAIGVAAWRHYGGMAALWRHIWRHGGIMAASRTFGQRRRRAPLTAPSALSNAARNR